MRYRSVRGETEKGQKEVSEEQAFVDDNGFFFQISLWIVKEEEHEGGGGGGGKNMSAVSHAYLA